MARILIVDDEAPIRTMLRDILEQEHEILEANNGNEAYGIIKNKPVDLIITDLVMPGKSGIDLILDLRMEYPDIRIMAISGDGGISGRFDYLPIAKLIGANTILHKPFHLHDIRAAVSNILA